MYKLDEKINRTINQKTVQKIATLREAIRLLYIAIDFVRENSDAANYQIEIVGGILAAAAKQDTNDALYRAFVKQESAKMFLQTEKK
jgi:dihydroxyacetone kinase DhaKLM complex PTS-EIIA-like component DhaM